MSGHPTGKTGSPSDHQSNIKSLLIKLLWLAGLIILGFLLLNLFGGGEARNKTRTLELEVSSLQPHQLCGVTPGEHKFVVPQKLFVLINSDNYEINSYIRINKTIPNETFTVESDGCVEVSFSFVKSFLEKPITPQIIHIAFR